MKESVIRLVNNATGVVLENRVWLHTHPTGDKVDYIGFNQIAEMIGKMAGWLLGPDCICEHSIYGEEHWEDIIVTLEDLEWGFCIGTDTTDMKQYPINYLGIIRESWNDFINKEV